MTSRVLTVDALSVDIATHQGRIEVLTDVAFHVDAGKTLGLVGESGSGKSMTAAAVMQLLPSAARITSGSVALQGTELTTLSEREMRSVRGKRVGMVFQEPMTALDPTFSVGDQVAQALRVHAAISRREAWRRAVGLLDRVGIPSAERRARDYPHHFSGGMRQRVVIAIALACDPPLILADEPTTALDVTVQDQILGLLDGLRAEHNLAMLFISHDLGVIADICDDVCVMHRGQIVERGSVYDVLGDPRHDYTRSLLQALPSREWEKDAT